MKYKRYRRKSYIDRVYRAKPPVGYCHCDTHMGYLSLKLVKKHECLKKECSFFEKYEDHPYWVEQKAKKERKKQRKLEQKMLLEQMGKEKG